MVKVWRLGYLVDAGHQKTHEARELCLVVARECLPQPVLLCSWLWLSCVEVWLLVFVWMV